MTFEENFLFETYKDTATRSCKNFKEMIKDFKNVDAYKIYREIINYQIKKYGQSLNVGITDYVSVERLRIRSNQRRKSYLKKRGLESPNSKRKRWTE